MNIAYLHRFISESNMIEHIFDYDEDNETKIYKIFLNRNHITIDFLKAFVQAIQPGVLLRDRIGLNVQVGQHIPIPGGPAVVTEFMDLLEWANNWYNDLWKTHIDYETLHPFTDGNGRSGRVLWLWQMQRRNTFTAESLTFLHSFYYQTLGKSR